MRFWDTTHERFVDEVEALDAIGMLAATGGRWHAGLLTNRIILMDDTPEVLLIHVVTPDTHIELLMLNGVEVTQEDHLDDALHTRQLCLTRVAVSVARALDTKVDERRLQRSDWEAAGEPRSKALADLAKSVPRTTRVFAAGAVPE
jgi:hypothetical protein